MYSTPTLNFFYFGIVKLMHTVILCVWVKHWQLISTHFYYSHHVLQGHWISVGCHHPTCTVPGSEASHYMTWMGKTLNDILASH